MIERTGRNRFCIICLLRHNGFFHFESGLIVVFEGNRNGLPTIKVSFNCDNVQSSWGLDIATLVCYEMTQLGVDIMVPF